MCAYSLYVYLYMVRHYMAKQSHVYSKDMQKKKKKSQFSRILSPLSLWFSKLMC